MKQTLNVNTLVSERERFDLSLQQAQIFLKLLSVSSGPRIKWVMLSGSELEKSLLTITNDVCSPGVVLYSLDGKISLHISGGDTVTDSSFFWLASVCLILLAWYCLLRSEEFADNPYTGILFPGPFLPNVKAMRALTNVLDLTMLNKVFSARYGFQLTCKCWQNTAFRIWYIWADILQEYWTIFEFVITVLMLVLLALGQNILNKLERHMA